MNRNIELSPILAAKFASFQGNQNVIVQQNQEALFERARLNVYMENLGKMLVNSHKLIDSKDTHLHNILDEIIALTFRTVYKLKYLK